MVGTRGAGRKWAPDNSTGFAGGAEGDYIAADARLGLFFDGLSCGIGSRESVSENSEARLEVRRSGRSVAARVKYLL